MKSNQQDYFQVITEASQDAIIIIDDKGEITFWNASAEKILGYSRHEILGRNLHEVMVPKSYHKSHVAGFSEFIRTGKGNVVNKTVEVEAIHREGRIIQVELSISGLKQGESWHALGIIRDITERKMFEEKMRNLTKAVEQSPVSIVITNLQGYIEYANPKVSVTTGYTLDELHGKNFRIMKSGETPPEEYKILWDTITKGETWKGTFHNKRKDGSLYWEYSEIGPIKDAQGKIVNFIAIKQDITETKKTQEEVANFAIRYQTILQTANDGIHVLDLDGKLIEANDTFCQMLGYQKEELIRMSVSDWDAQWEGEALMSRVKNISEIQSVFETRHRRKDGSILDVEIKTSTLILNGQSLQCAISRDITLRKQIELEIKSINEELQKLNAEKDKFLSIIAHDLRGPMGSLMQLAELLADEEQDLAQSETREITSNLTRMARDTFNLLENLLRWSLLNMGKFDFKPQKNNLLTVVQECTDILAEQARRKEIKIVVGITKEHEVVADINMLQTVVRNLLSNALKYSHKGGQITISAKSFEDNQTMVSVKDTGIGMPEELKNNLFRLDANTKRRGTQGESSTGLGLQLCKEFIEKQGGKISIESELNVGSVFSSVQIFQDCQHL